MTPTPRACPPDEIRCPRCGGEAHGVYVGEGALHFTPCRGKVRQGDGSSKWCGQWLLLFRTGRLVIAFAVPRDVKVDLVRSLEGALPRPASLLASEEIPRRIPQEI